MTRVPSPHRTSIRASHLKRAVLAVVLAAVAWGCADKIVGPQVVEPKGQVGVFADVGPSGVTTLVITVSGPGIVKPDNSPDTLAFNIPLVNGIASGSLQVPAGPNRVITASAFVGVTQTHRGSVTANILEGNNPTLQITLVPLVGNLPLTVSIGSTIVTVRPLLASVAVNDTLRLSAEIRDHNGQVVNDRVRWATLNPLKASVDTLGLVTVRDTGAVQIVATYGTVGGASKVTGVAVPSVAANHLTWNGSVNTNWTEVNNWTPHGLGVARVPTLTDSVVIPAGAPRYPVLPCVDNSAVRDILIEQGGQLNPSSCYNLNVYGSAVVRGPIPAVNLRPNAKIAGSFEEIYVLGDGARLIDSVTATYVQVAIPNGTFLLNGEKLRTTGDLYVSDGTITMAAGDTLIIDGNTTWNGDDQTGLITGGVVFSRGNQFYGYRYFASGTNRLVLDRTATGQQTLGGFDHLNNPNNAQANRLEIKNRDGVYICGHIRVMDTLSFVSTGTPATMSTCSSYHVRAMGPVVTSANTDVVNYWFDLRHATGTSLVAGTWHPQVTEFAVEDGVIKSTLAYQALRFSAKNTLSANVTITDYLYLNGATTELNLGGRKLTVGEHMETNNGATLKMTSAADSLVIAEYAYFPHDFHSAQKPKLTAGVISIGAYMYGFGFASAGTKVLMTGTGSNGSRYISGMNSDSRPAQELYDLEYGVGSTYSVCERTKVMNTVVVRSGATLNNTACGSGTLAVFGNLITETTSSVNPYQVELHSATGTSNVSGAYAAVHTDFNVANAIIKPGLAYGNIRIHASNQLTGPTTATGWVYANGNGVDLKINGHKLTIGQHLQFDNNSTLTMTNAADSVIVGNYGYFNSNTSAVQEAKLTAGVLSIGEYLYGFGFNASGTHKVVMAGTSANTQRYFSGMNYESRPTQGFQNLEIAAGQSYGVCERALVKGTLTVSAGATLDNGPCGSPYIRIDGNVVAPATSTIAPYNVALHTSSGTQNVDGTFSPDYTSLHTTVAAGQLKAGLGYKNVQFLAPATLGANMTVNGLVNVSGPSAALTLNGKTLTITGNLNVDNNGVIIMNNANDVLDVGGNVSWSSSGSEVGKLTAGTAIFRGSTFCGSKYETSVAHKTIFQRGTSDPLRFQCVSSSSTAQLMYNVDVKGSGVLLECSLNVSNDLRVFAGSALSMSTGCGSGTLYVGNNLIGDMGSAITNGTNYPSSSQLHVVFGGALGTQNVAGAYSAHVSYFTAPGSYIQPTLVTNSIDYKHMRIDQSTVFQDSTEIDGGLEIINNAIVDLNGNTVVVKGTMDLNNTSKLRMVSSSDTLVVAYGDAAAEFYWDGGDNLNDGTNPLLTAGAVKFYGDRFYGPMYKATVQGASRHRFIFASPASGSISLEGNPQFANLHIQGPRPIANNSSIPLVKDSLIMDASTTYGGSNQLQVLGDIVMASGSDLGVATIYVDGPKGTSLVNGSFHPTTTLFRAATPAANAIKTGLGYQNVSIQTGLYSLSTGTTAIANDLDISSSGKLSINGQTLTVGGQLTTGSSGSLHMNQSTDVVTVAGLVQFNASPSTTSLSGGTLTVSGNYNMFENISATGTHKLVLTGSAAKSVSSLSGTSRALNNFDISGTGAVNLNSGVVVNGSFRILTPVAVTGSNSDVVGNFETIAGSSFTHGSLGLSAAAGTSLVNGTLNVTTIDFATGSQTIKSGFTYGNLNIGGSASVSPGSLNSTGTVTVAAGGSLIVPSGSTLKDVTINGASGNPGTVSFLGSSLSLGTLTVNNFGVTEATADLTPSVFVDFARIAVNTGGTLNNGDRSSGQGGFRYKTTGTPNGLLANGTFTSSLPGSQP